MYSSMTKTFGTNLTNDQNFSQTSAQLSQREKTQVIDRLIAILSENKLKPWVSVGLKEEYQRRHNHRLPDDWLNIIEECGRDLIEIETLSLSNGSKTLIQLPIRKIKTENAVTPPPVVTKPMIVTPKSEKPEDKPLVDLKPTEEPKKIVPKLEENRRQLNCAGDQTKSAPDGSAHSNGVSNNLIEFYSGTPDDVINGGIPIPPPVLPNIKPMPINAEDFFDVVVVLAATPFNFIVVPYKNVSDDSEFYDLKLKMLEMYEKEENKIDLPPIMIKQNLFFAAKANNMWYRVQVMTIVSEDPFQMIGYLCDFGEHKTFSLDNIQPLYGCFRTLPMQAIRASLSTVEPNGSDWDVITSIEFRKLVENKPFVATVYGLKKVDNNPVLELSLCDTSGEDDLFIGKELVKRNLAKPVVPYI